MLENMGDTFVSMPLLVNLFQVPPRCMHRIVRRGLSKPSPERRHVMMHQQVTSSQQMLNPAKQPAYPEPIKHQQVNHHVMMHPQDIMFHHLPKSANMHACQEPIKH